MRDTYAKIAEKAFTVFLDESANFLPLACPANDPTGSIDRNDRNDRNDRKSENGIKTIVFSVMAIETAVYDLACIKLGETVAGEYLRKMDLRIRWIIVLRLICGRSFREDGLAVTSLKHLTKAHDALVHQ